MHNANVIKMKGEKMTYDLTLIEINTQGLDSDLNGNFEALKDTVNAKAEKNGDSTQKFNVDDAVQPTEAINKRQLDNSVAAIDANIATKADKSYVDEKLALKANTADVNAELAQKADLNGNATQVFNVADAVTSTEAINKGQLDSAITTFNGEISDLETAIQNSSSKIKFCMNSGNVNANGDADLLSYSGLIISTKTGGSYANATGTNVVGTQVTLNSAVSITLPSTAGTYNIFLTTAGTLEAFATTLYFQKIVPSSPVTNDIWLNTSQEPLTAKKYNGSAWGDYTGILVGTAIVSGGVVTSVFTKHYNENGYDRPYKYDSGWFAVTKVTNYSKIHNLGTSNIKYIVLIADDARGTNQRQTQPKTMILYGIYLGYISRETTSSTLSIETASDYVGIAANGADFLVSSYYRIIAETI